MSGDKRPDGRQCLLAQTALTRLNQRERRERELTSSNAPFPFAAAWVEARRGAIRLIDLERRARFARVAS